MQNFKIQLNHIYIFLSLFFIISCLFGHNNNSYLFNSNIEIIVLNLLFIFANLNSPNDNIFLRIYLSYFLIYLINIYFIPFNGYISHSILREVPLLEISNNINNLSLHFILLFFLIRIIFINSENFLNKSIEKKKLYNLIKAISLLTLISLILKILIEYLDYKFSLSSIFSVLLSLDKLLVISTILVIIFWKKLNFSYKSLCILIILTCISVDFLSKSKSSIFYFSLILIICFFYIKKEIYINFKLFLFGIVLFISSISAYFLALNPIDEVKDMNDLINIFFSFINRISFFEFYLEKNSLEIYENVISLSYNLKAFIDKITPSFDIYGYALMKNQLHYLFHYFDGTDYSGVVSEQSTLFAISNRIFGYYFIFYYISVLYLFKFFYSKIHFLSVDKKIIIQVSTFVLFINWLDGFGLDQFLMITFYYVIFLFILFFISNIFNKVLK